VLIGEIPVRPAGLALFAVSLPLAFLVDFLAYLVIGLGAFWLENTSGLTIIYSRANMMLGGMMLPLTLFPERLQRALDHLPFAQVIYGPARLLVKPDPRFLVGLLERQLVAAAVLSAVAVMVHRAALRRIHAHGG
jgi:ABC-2 type transport system permease protein